MKRLVSYLLCASLLIPLINIFAAPSSSAKAPAGESARKADIQSGIQRLKSNTSGAALVSISTATGAARFVRMPSGAQAGLPSGTGSAQDKSAAFFRDYGSAFGVTSAASELKFDTDVADKIGGRHLTYRQVYMNVPVFAGVLKTHFDAAGVLRAVNGNFIPDINLNPAPSRKAGEAAAVAVEHVKANPGDGESGAKSNAPLAAVNSALYVFRANLAQGIPGQNHLVWEVEVTNGADVRDRVYVDAHTLKIVDMISGNHEALSRRAYDGMNLPNVPPGYPATPFWVEGQAFPTGNTEADNMIIASKETYDLYNNGFSRDSIDGAGALMDSIFNRGYGCPNASWNGTFISFCPGFTTDDVTSHEWSHAYTQYTHNLIYQWQPGALNEAYSDIFGETVDRINGRDDVGNSGTDSARVVGNCSTFSPPVAQHIVNSPASIAGTYPAQAAQFGPALTGTGVTGRAVLAVDDNTDPIGGTDVNDGCGVITNGAALTGNIALIRRGTCNFSAKVYNAQQAGAVAVLIFNNVSTGLPGMGAGVNAGLVTIPSIGISQTEGNNLMANLSATEPNVTMKSSVGSLDNSTKWLMGEDVSPGGALRDMYNPICYSNPGKVSDTAYYVCSTADGGGVHTNSGVPNHAYALLVDGGTYNGQTISALGLTKAAHIYFRAESVYQHSASDFLDHADSIEQSATDLIGQNLASLTNGTPSGEIISAADVTEVQQAVLAVELRTPPTFCGFLPLLAQSPPAVTCGAGTSYAFIFSDNFEGNNSDWTVSNTPVNPATHDVPDWVATTALPDNRTGTAFFGANPAIGDCAADDESGVQHLESPTISVPSIVTNAPILRFEHWVATEPSFDGGQLSVSVDGGAYTLVPQAAFIYNAPNLVLATAGAGNTNPRQGQRAWSGTDGGSVDGSWGTSVVDLSQVGVTGGHTVKLRYDMGQDGCGGNFGWYIDNLQITWCSSPTAAPAQISGRITTPDGAPLGGVSMRLSGARTARVITDAGGNYRFENVDGDNFYTVTPTLVNYHFSPESQSFMLAANNVDAVFTATRDAVSSGNAIDTADYFVRQHYLDFLGREPDASGFNFWSDQILSCGGDSTCRERRTINVSAAYFLSIEFQQTGGLVDGLYRSSYGRAPRYAEFMPDTAVVARDVVVGRANWAQTLEANKQAFVATWMERADFRAAYDGLTNAAFVDSLISHTAGFNGDRSGLVNGLNGGSLSRAAALRQIVENEGFITAKHNEMFVMMEYFGYLRRDPDASGYAFWLNKLNQFNGNFEQAEMVKAFIVSGEYRDRFRQ